MTGAPTHSPNSRIEWLDAARGIGIVLVVFGHVLRGLFGADIATDPTWHAIDYKLYTFHMPLFFLLAGVSVTFGHAQPATDFLKNKVWTVAYPYFLWSLIQGGVMIAMSSHTNAGYNPSVLWSIGWEPIAQFWFLYVLMLCHLTMPVLKLHMHLLPYVVAGGLIGSSFFAPDSASQRILHSLSFYAAGLWLADRIKGLPPLNNVSPIVGALAIFGLCSVAALKLDPSNTKHVGAAPAAIAGVAATLLIARALKGRAAKYCAALGAASMTIYVLHILFGAGARIALIKLNAPDNVWLHLFAGVLIALAAPFFIHILLSRWRLLWPLGLAAPPKKTRAKASAAA
jgi:fucose 4-O-acetylase-like acetyltransferase